MKLIVVAVLLFAILGNCYAVSIEVQESVPANTVWSFSVALPSSDDFDKAEVFLDGEKIAGISGGSGIDVLPSSIDKTKVFSNTEPVGNRVYFLISPVSSGEHRLRLEIDNEEKDEENINFFEIYDADEKADLQTQINSVRGSVNSLIEQTNSFEETLGDALTESDRQALQSSINSVQNSLNSLESRLEEEAASSTSKANVLMEDLEYLKARTNDLNASIFGTGLFSLGNIGAEAQAGLAFLVIAVVAAVLLVKFKDRIPLKKGLYGSGKKSEALFSRHDEDIAEQVLQESQDEGKKGKWAAGSAQEPKEEPKRKGFSIGDLLRK